MASYAHGCTRIGPGTYRISWTVDYRVKSGPMQRIRFPRGFWRITDERGATEFCRKHGIKLMPGGFPPRGK